MEEETIFEKILRHEELRDAVYEDEHTLAFLSIEPVHKGHTLVIPKHKCRNALDCPPDVVAHVYQTAQKVALRLREVLGADGVNIHTNIEPAADQAVFYFHVHVIPRYTDKHPFKTIIRETYDEGEMHAYAERLHFT